MPDLLARWEEDEGVCDEESAASWALIPDRPRRGESAGRVPLRMSERTWKVRVAAQ